MTRTFLTLCSAHCQFKAIIFNTFTLRGKFALKKEIFWLGVAPPEVLYSFAAIRRYKLSKPNGTA